MRSGYAVRMVRRLLCAALALFVAVGLMTLPTAEAEAESLAEAQQRLAAARARAKKATHRVTSRQQRLATAVAEVGRRRAAVRVARRNLRRLLRELAPAHRRTSSAGRILAAANIAVADAHDASEAARAAMHRMARTAYMNASSASELTMLLGFAAEGPRGLNNLAQRDLAVTRLENRSVLDARSAAEVAAVAESEAAKAVRTYEALVAAEADLQRKVSEARRVLVEERTALREAREDVTRLEAAVARAQRQDVRARKALRRAKAAYRRAVRRSPGGVPPVSAPPASKGNAAQYVWDTLRCNGFTEQAAAGVLGNLQQESGIDPTTVQSGGPGMGLAQWSRGGRWDYGPNSLLAFAAARGLDPWDAETQTRFMIYEMKLGWGGFDLAAFRRMTDILAATIYFHDVYERSADSSTFVATVRGGYALHWYGQLSGSRPKC